MLSQLSCMNPRVVKLIEKKLGSCLRIGYVGYLQGDGIHDQSKMESYWIASSISGTSGSDLASHAIRSDGKVHI